MQPNILPNVKGEYRVDFALGAQSCFKVGGNCDVVFIPADIDDLLQFLTKKPKDLAITVLGNMSNVLISDYGIRGCVIRLNNLNKTNFYNNYVEVQAGTLLSKFISDCTKHEVSCCEKLCCIPGTIGGAIFMNAGIPGFEISDVLISVSGINFFGEKKTLNQNALNMTYRNGNIPKDFIVTSARLKTFSKDTNQILAEIKELQAKRLKSQPIGQATCGSTFKNPDGAKAWELIKRAGCDKLSVGGAIVSEKHCNFLINTGNAKASDFVKLINIIKSKVLQKTGYELQEEIKKIGDKW